MAFQHNNAPYYVGKLTLGATSISTAGGTRVAALYSFRPTESSYLISAIDVPPLRMSQAVVAHAVARTSLETANQAAPAPVLPVSFDVIFDLAIRLPLPSSAGGSRLASKSGTRRSR
jgi:hypothetical protein